jgi:hypothetical protein
MDATNHNVCDAWYGSWFAKEIRTLLKIPKRGISMRNRYLIAVSIAIALLLIASVYAVYTLTISYTEFNSTSRTDHGTNYTANSWTVTIINNLVFDNVTNFAKIFITNSSSTGYFGINLNLANDTDGYSLDVLVASKIDPSAGDWVRVKIINNLAFGKAIKVSLDSKGYLSVFDDVKIYVDKYKILTAYPASYIGAQGSGTDVASSGSVDVTVGAYSQNPTQIINAFIPIVITFAMLGIALSFISKFQRG